MRGLLSRLAHGHRRVDAGASIRGHLEELLNARSIVDLTDRAHALPDGVRAVENTVRGAIERLEPRLVQVGVRYVPSRDPLRLELSIRARLAADPTKIFCVGAWVQFPGRFQIT